MFSLSLPYLFHELKFFPLLLQVTISSSLTAPAMRRPFSLRPQIPSPCSQLILLCPLLIYRRVQGPAPWQQAQRVTQNKIWDATARTLQLRCSLLFVTLIQLGRRLHAPRSALFPSGSELQHPPPTAPDSASLCQAACLLTTSCSFLLADTRPTVWKSGITSCGVPLLTQCTPGAHHELPNF